MQTSGCGPNIGAVRLLGHPRRQEARQLARAAVALVPAALAGLLGLAVAVEGATALAAGLVIVAASLVACGRMWARLGRRNGVGAQSERRVRRALAPLRTEG